jgi:V8-like Glu-specific endopeptidase
MINLSIEDRKQLMTLLKDLPELATESSRRALLQEAGLEKLIPMIDLSGQPFVVVSTIVTYLSKYGRLTHDHEALGLFLNTLKGFIGIQQQELINELLIKYEMMTPIATLPNVGQWRGKETTADVLEKIIGEDTLRPIAFLQKGIEVSHPVSYIQTRSSHESWSGTGFLVTEDLLLTNNHVLPSADILQNTIFRFNYEDDFQGHAQPSDEYSAKSGGLFLTNQNLDYTLVQLDRKPGKKWGWLPLSPRTIQLRERVNIIQHPAGRPKEISFQNNFVEYIGGDVVQYITSTLNGSSGSPVLNDGWEVVALHHSGGNILEPTTQRRYFRNEGILVETILADLPLEVRKLLNEAVN